MNSVAPGLAIYGDGGDMIEDVNAFEAKSSQRFPARVAHN